MTREEAIIAMVNGGIVQPIKQKEIVCYYDSSNNFPFRMSILGKDISVNMLSTLACKEWKIYKATKVWQFAYKSQGNANNIVGEVSKHMTEEKAKEKYGDNCIKLEWTEKEVGL